MGMVHCMGTVVGVFVARILNADYSEFVLVYYLYDNCFRIGVSIW